MAREVLPQTTEHCTVERDGHVVIVTMNRPEARNALTPQMLAGMADAWQLVDDDPDVRAAILTGAGGVFSAGADLKAMNNQQADDRFAERLRSEPDLAWKALLRHHHLKKPLIAAVEGYAVAGGTEVLQATHVRVAGESATFGIYEAKRGLFPLGGSTVRLVRQIPKTIALEILLTARPVSAAEARAIGLVGRVVPDGTALDTALEIAGQIAANGPLAVQAILRSVRETESLPEDEALKVELEIGMPVFLSEDAREGTAAFAEKRPPVFVGR